MHHSSMCIGTTNIKNVFALFRIKPLPPLRFSNTFVTWPQREILFQFLFLGLFCWCVLQVQFHGWLGLMNTSLLRAALGTFCKLRGRWENSFWQHRLSNYCKKNLASCFCPKQLYFNLQWKKSNQICFSLSLDLILSCFIFNVIMLFIWFNILN